MTASLPLPSINNVLLQLDGAEQPRTHRSLFDIVTEDISWWPGRIATSPFENAKPRLFFDGSSRIIKPAFRPTEEVRAEYGTHVWAEKDRTKNLGGELRLRIREHGALWTEIVVRINGQLGGVLGQVFVVGEETRFPILGYPHPITMGQQLSIQLNSFRSCGCDIREYQESYGGTPFENILGGEVFWALFALESSINWKELNFRTMPRKTADLERPLLRRIREIYKL